MPERRFPGMLDHGGRAITQGRTSLLGPDRPHQRPHEPLAASRETVHKRVDTQAAAVTAPPDKVAESEAKGHGTRLEQRQGTWATLDHERQDAKAQHAQRSAHAAALGPAGQRAARDVRQQTIRTMRTLWLEHRLRTFLVALGATRHTQVSLARVLSLRFARRGARRETPSQVVSWVHTAGLSLAHRRLLREIVDGLGAMDVQDQGKPMLVRLKEMPP